MSLFKSRGILISILVMSKHASQYSVQSLPSEYFCLYSVLTPRYPATPPHHFRKPRTSFGRRQSVWNRNEDREPTVCGSVPRRFLGTHGTLPASVNNSM
ncbi:hypothetical protein BDW02DRAFT_564524 [Decorospora gaudefroyi]|uniref:Uncharacterized protein n=1 Tax=Decorospora gaudefroyi TaxID=184978 RepID=A0A6A5KVB8_9PLEO|nr:hypothetical protein BDW02DRAFT_564524 [Decorospora gaudefroyi]